MKFNISALILIFSLCLFSCKKETENQQNYLPIVFVHGLLGSGDSYEWMVKRFTSNGYPSDMIFTYDWNTVGGQTTNTPPLNNFIQKVLQQTGHSKVHLVGHSLGGGLSFNFCKNELYATQIASVSLIAPYITDRTGFPAATIPALNLWPDTDYVVTNGDSIPGARNVFVLNRDHNEMAACDESFTEIYKLITGKLPAQLTVTSEAKPIISGKVVSFVENNSGAGAKVEVYEVDPLTGFRKTPAPIKTFIAKTDNSWGPMAADPNAYYEFKVSTGKTGDRALHYYREPFIHSDHLVYLRLYPQSNSIFNLVLSNVITVSSTKAVGIFYSASKALWLGRDELSVNGVSLNSPTFTAPELNTVAMFLYDSNNNQNTDTTSVALFNSFQSLKGIDFHFTVNASQSNTYNYNGRILHTPSWPSSTEGIGVVVYE